MALQHLVLTTKTLVSSVSPVSDYLLLVIHNNLTPQVNLLESAIEVRVCGDQPFLSIFPGLCADGDVRLIGGNSALEGRVEMCYNEEWGTICDLGFGRPEAAVVCNQFGYSGDLDSKLLCCCSMHVTVVLLMLLFYILVAINLPVVIVAK